MMGSERSFEGEWWVLLVTDGLTVSYPPEVYAREASAEREAERWCSILTSIQRPIARPFPGRWEVGDHWVRLVPARLLEDIEQIWVGMHWTRSGDPDPEAELFGNREQARSWALTPPLGGLTNRVLETPWTVAATYRVREGEEESVVHLAKVIE